MRGVVVDQIVHVVGEPEGRFVAGGNEAGEPGHAVGVAERQQHRAALGDDADVAGAERLRERGAVHAGLVGDVGIAHAVGAAEQQAGLMAEIVDAPLHGPAFPARFGKSAGKTPDPLDACGVRLLKHGQQRTAAQQHGGAVRRGGEIAQGRVAGVPKDFLILWVDGIHRTRIAEALHVPEDDGTRPAVGGCADHRDGAWREQGIQFPRGFFHGRLLCPAVRGVPCGVLVWDTGCFCCSLYELKFIMRKYEVRQKKSSGRAEKGEPCRKIFVFPYHIQFKAFFAWKAGCGQAARCRRAWRGGKGGPAFQQDRHRWRESRCGQEGGGGAAAQ